MDGGGDPGDRTQPRTRESRRRSRGHELRERSRGAQPGSSTSSTEHWSSTSAPAELFAAPAQPSTEVPRPGRTAQGAQPKRHEQDQQVPATSDHEAEEKTSGSHLSSRSSDGTIIGRSQADDLRESAIKDAEEKRMYEQLQADIKREDMKNNFHNQNTFNKDMATMQKLRGENFKEALEALGVDTKTMRSVEKNKVLSSVARMLFLVILVGCELDVVGFVMAAPSYWGTGFAIVRVMLIVGPVSYIVALLMYKMKSGPESDKSKQTSRDGDQSIRGGLTTQPPQASDLDEVKKRNKAFGGFTNRERVKVEMYHCLPVVRMYLVMKDTVPNDVECVFRANSLSSFTLGTSQLVGFLFTMIGSAPLDIFQKINIASFSVNWAITLIYFATSIPNRMKASMAADAVEYQTTVMLQREFVDYKKNVDKYASTGSPKDKEDVLAFLHKVEREIQQYTSVKVAIANEQFTPMEVNKLRRAVHSKFNNEYANIV